MLKRVMGKCSLIAVACSLSLSAFAVAETPSNLDVSAGELVAALKELARQSDVELVYQPQQLKGLKTEGLKGSYSAQEAIEILLKGTELRVHSLESGAMVIAPKDAGKGVSGMLPSSEKIRAAQAEAASPTVEADGARNSSADQKEILEEVVVTVFGRGVEESAREVPQTIDVYQREFIDTVNAQTLGDVVRFVPNAAPSLSEGPDPLYSFILIRGFESTSTWDGLGFRESTTPNMAGVERIEVLKGPASVLYGSMEPGAVVNIVTKRPKSEFHAASELRVGSYNEVGISGDVGGPLSEGIRARLNAVYRKTDTILDNSGLRDVFVAPVIEFDLAERTLLTLDGYYEKRSWPNGFSEGQLPLSTVPGLGDENPLGTLPKSTNLTYDTDISGPDGPMSLTQRTTDVDANARLSHQFEGHDLSLNVALSYHRQSSYRVGIGGFLGSITDDRTYPRFFTIQKQTKNPGSRLAHIDFSGAFSTGVLSHKFTVGADYYRRRPNEALYYYDFAAPSNDLFEPVYGNITVPDVIPWIVLGDEATTKGYFIQDRMSYGRWHLLAGGRYSDQQNSSFYALPGEGPVFSDVKDKVWTPQVGLLYDLTDKIAFFASRAEAFVPQSAFSISRGSYLIVPETSVQYEAGVKIGIGERDMSVNATVFHIKKDNILTAHPTIPNEIAFAANAVSKGVELSIDGRLAPGVTMYAGYGYNKTVNDEGRPFPRVPEHTLSLVGQYEVQGGSLQGLGVSGSLQYTGEAWSFASRLKTPSWTRLNLGVSYPITNKVDVSLNVNNVLDEGLYGVNDYENSIWYWQERTYFGTVNVRF